MGRGDHRFALGIERDDGDRIPIACMTRPAARVNRSRPYIHSMPSGKDVVVLTGMTLCGADVADAAMLVIVVVPVDERFRPESRVLQIGKPFCRKLRTVLGRAKQGFAESVIITHSGTRVRRFQP